MSEPAVAPVPRVSVVMPTFEQAAFLPRAVESLLAQTLPDWELVVVDDGSEDATPEAVAGYLGDPRVRYERLAANVGVAGAANRGLDLARAPTVAYLPSDDVYYPEHLATLVEHLEAEPGAVVAYSGARHHYDQTSEAEVPGRPLQPVQVLHRATAERWVEREELATDDWDRLFWSKLRPLGRFVGTGRASCWWTEHPAQMSKLIHDRGINPFRHRYRVRSPLRFQPLGGELVDEVAHYRRFRDRPDTPPADDGLKIVLVGELAFNPERILALEERGHRLYGLWTPDGWWFNTVGPVPFGHVEELPRTGWRAALRALRPDVIYGLLNWQAVPFVHAVLEDNPGVPFVWHHKESPFACMEHGSWPELVDLHTRTDAQVYASTELRDWFRTVLPGRVPVEPTLVLDGDLPKLDWFAAERSPRLSEAAGEAHTVVLGRPLGLTPALVGELARAGVHLHCYGLRGAAKLDVRRWVDEASRLAPRHLHTHPSVSPQRWVAELSRYDAGWLHVVGSRNGGDLRRAAWDDLNLPARMGTLGCAGLPMILRDNPGSVVAAAALAERLGVGIGYRDAEELGARLRDRPAMEGRWERAWRARPEFAFDTHADRLVELFRRVAR